MSFSKKISRHGFWDGDLHNYLRRFVSVTLSSAGLVIKAGGSALCKSGSAFIMTINGTLVTKPANTDMAAFAGTVTNAAFNIFVHRCIAAGTLSTSMGTEGATLAAVLPPAVLEDSAVIGITLINPTGTGNFVGGTTALDDATVAPGTLHFNCVGIPSLDLSTLIGAYAE